jgi:glyoxylase-like metal-dependent hydrolase (beta-lactamase superfamily II)
LKTALAFALALATACLALPAAAQDLSKVEIKTTKLSDTVHMMVGSGGNLALCTGEDTTFLVDDQFAPLTAKINAAVAAVTPKAVGFVLNTHWHFDHTGGNENYGKAGSIIVAHDNVRKRMDSEQLIEFLGMRTKPSPKAALPVITFSADTTFHLNGEEIHAYHAPRAHTDGDVVVLFRRSNVVHMGDIYFNGMYPFIDTSSGGTVDGVIAAADRVLAITDDATKIIPGHGPLSNRAELKAYRDMLAAVSGRIRQMIRDGRKLEEIVAANPSADFDGTWGKGFIAPAKFAEMLTRNLILAK